MSEDRIKRQKIEDDARLPSAIVLQSEQVTAAVTVLTVLPGGGSDSTVFSGHRDGTICRWDINDDDPTKSSSMIWVISACPDLTQHEVYGTEEKLGIAGLVVRSLPQDANGSEGDDAFLLYSWNHQREDMRESNGIPQKVMIWNCRNGERCSALMVDVGRCDTGLFANPLVSCLVFCQLLVDPPPTSTTQLPSGELKEPAKKIVTKKILVDAIVVGLQATCDESTAIIADSQPPSSCPSPGNILPFDERTRRRMPPWSASGGFVRALMVLKDSSYVVSITETIARRRKKPEESTSDKEVITSGEGDSFNVGGELHEITIWDCNCPGTALCVLSLHDIVSMTCEKSLDGGHVFAVSVWNDQIVLAISSSRTDTSGSAAVLKVKRNTSPDFGCSLAVIGMFNPYADVCAASSHASSWIALSTTSSGSHPVVKVYDFRDVPTVIKDNDDGRPSAVFDLGDLERATISSPSLSTVPSQSELEVISIGASHVMMGYSNGTIVRESISIAPSFVNDKVSNESVSCSNAPVGLRGVLCPHLSSDANNVHLQNQCVIV